jgi:hypothetical protein
MGKNDKVSKGSKRLVRVGNKLTDNRYPYCYNLIS